MLGKVKVNVGSKPDGAPSVPQFPAPAAHYTHLAKVLRMLRMLSPEPGDPDLIALGCGLESISIQLLPGDSNP